MNKDDIANMLSWKVHQKTTDVYLGITNYSLLHLKETAIK